MQGSSALTGQVIYTAVRNLFAARTIRPPGVACLNLSVRIAKWSSHFVTFETECQEMIIERTIHAE